MADPTGGLRALVDQMQQASDAGLYFAALTVALTLPDICGACASQNGQASGSKYRAWLEQNADTFGPRDAQTLYEFRCSLLHQGSAQHRSGTRFAFIEPAPGAPQLHNMSTDVAGEIVTWISVPRFVEEMATGVTRWLDAHGHTTLVQRNLERFVRRRPEGLPPHVRGAPVVS